MLWLDGSLIIRESWRTDDAARLLLPSGWIAALPAAAYAADELDAVYEVIKVLYDRQLHQSCYHSRSHRWDIAFLLGLLS